MCRPHITLSKKGVTNAEAVSAQENINYRLGWRERRKEEEEQICH